MTSLPLFISLFVSAFMLNFLYAKPKSKLEAITAVIGAVVTGYVLLLLITVRL